MKQAIDGGRMNRAAILIGEKGLLFIYSIAQKKEEKKTIGADFSGMALTGIDLGI